MQTFTQKNLHFQQQKTKFKINLNSKFTIKKTSIILIFKNQKNVKHTKRNI
jgi:hypothetical protein